MTPTFIAHKLERWWPAAQPDKKTGEIFAGEAGSTIAMNPYAIARVLVLVAIFLVLASIGGQLTKFVYGHDYLKGFVPLFNLDAENNIPTFFTVLLILFTSMLLSIIALLKRSWTKSNVSKWWVLSIGFLFMAYDEAFQVHEKLSLLVKASFVKGSHGIFFYAWVIPGIALVLGLALFFLRFMLSLSVTTRRHFLIAATLYLSGAIGFELIGGRYHELHGDQNLMYCMLVTIEESLEMAGIIFFIWALLVYLADHYKEVRIGFNGFQK